MTTLHETEVDGVRCFWVDTERPTLAAMLLFRFGSADESIGESGWQHLLEHMALEKRKYPGLEFNGHVGLLDTGFQAHGPAAEVVDFLDQVTRWLAAPGLDALENESRVLRSEQSARGQSAAMSVLSMRYGARGPGVVGYGEPGTGRATATLLAERARSVFTRGNAVLVLDGPPPAELRLHLAPGDLIAPRVAVPCDDELPAAYVSDAGLVLSGVVPRSVAMAVGHDLLRRRLSERLREERGAAYAPWSSYEPVDAENAVIIGGSDVHREQIGPVGDLTLMLARGLARTPPDEVEVADLKAAYVRGLKDPYAKVRVAARAAHEYLTGRPPLTFDEMIAEAEEITPERIGDGWKAFGATLLLGLPGETTWADQLPMLSFPRTVPERDGTRYRSADWPANRARLTVGATGVEISFADEAQRVPLDEVAAMLTFEDDRRYLLRHDGYGLMVRGQAWQRGTSAISRIDEVVPSELHLPQPGLLGPDAPRMGVGRRWWSWATSSRIPLLRGFDRYTVGVLATVAVGVALFVVCVASGLAGKLVPIPVLTILVIRLILRQQDESRRSR